MGVYGGGVAAVSFSNPTCDPLSNYVVQRGFGVFFRKPLFTGPKIRVSLEKPEKVVFPLGFAFFAKVILTNCR